METYAVERLGGLNLVEDPQEAGAQQAISCLNVTLDRNGRLRTRDGYTTLYTSGVVGEVVASLYPVSTGVILATTLTGGAVKAINLGTGTATTTVASSNTASFAAAGSGSVYFTDTTVHQVRKYSGGVFSSPAGLAAYNGKYLAVQPLDDRLVIADAINTSRVWFSDAATPETITYTAGPPETGNFVDLTPGDGQAITGMAVFDTSLVVFKRTKFFVFDGNSTDTTGGTFFNYRMVDMGIGCDDPALPSTGLVATHETGIYFVGYDGVYRTTGGAPQKISGAISPVFRGANLPIPAPFSSTLASPVVTWYTLAASTDRLYLSGLGSGGAIQFVMDLATGEWVASQWPALSVMDGALIADSTDTAGYRGATIFGGTSTAQVAKASRTYTDDNGTAISWHHQSGWYDLGFPGQEKILRRSRVSGTGTVTLSRFADYATSDANAAALTLGSSAVATTAHAVSWRGTLLSQKLSGSGAAVVSALSHDIRNVRPVGVRSA